MPPSQIKIYNSFIHFLTASSTSWIKVDLALYLHSIYFFLTYFILDFIAYRMVFVEA